ncbi:hypothetical protein CBR_g26292 [Chara braunii]|uniref:Uncharacterized protein n=1 Tax=Chara braunii TaxID=69332 RepID=A0A388L7F8_CHABU|nr:hypothetical protein CBR_g26292 [Chara braunii]|eukprot:GBG78261.1 hypothetical protein CBR_g26292 [Chara braunii]
MFLQCVVIEDAPAGVKAAHAAGMRCIALMTSVAHEVLKSENPTLMKSSISDVCLETIRSLQYPSRKDTMRQQEGEHQMQQLGNVRKGEEGMTKAKGVDVEERRIVLEEENEGASALATTKAGEPGEDTDDQAWLVDPGFLDAEVALPNGYATTRRDILKLASAGMGSFAVFTALSRAKALSYISPKAVLNEMFGFIRPSMTGVAVAGEDRVGRFRGFLKDLEKRN